MTRIVTVFLFTLASAVPTCGEDLPAGVVDTQNPNDVPLTPQESLARITVPDGFHVTLFAGEPDVRRPIAFDFDDRGRLWVVENYSHPVWREDAAHDRILILEDADGDGRFDNRTVFWDEGRYVTGIAVGHGGVWIANTPELAFIPDRDGDDVPDSEPIAMLDGFQIDTNNVLNNFHWGPDGWLYGAIGLSTVSRVGKPGTPADDRISITRGMWRFHPVDHTFEVLAEGMVNPWGADFNQYGDLITTNTVIAHLWHIVPGMYCQRRDGEYDNPYAYSRIQSITDHLHWGGGTWQSSRSSKEHHDQRHSVAGGGHAHCGAMIYLADNWPDKYWGTLFTNNLHGNRVNNDRLIPHMSTYVGVHADDFLFGNDPWFRGMSVKYGADGGVYISDWHDIGECHDTDGSHRSSGRIYKVVYGKTEHKSIDLQHLSNRELAELHLHPNEWYVRHARRILQERATAGMDVSMAARKLQAIFVDNDDELMKLRALWTRFVINDLDETELVDLFEHGSEHVRRWAVRFLVDQAQPDAAATAAMSRLAVQEESPKVRLALATSLQKVDYQDRWPLAEALLSHTDDARDPYLPSVIWYGVEPLVMSNPATALELATRTEIPLLRRHIARRLLDCDSPRSEQVVRAALGAPVEHVRFDLLHGMLDALEPLGSCPVPSSWSELYEQARASSNPGLRSSALRLATIFGDAEAISNLRVTVLDAQVPLDERGNALRALLMLPHGVPVSMLHTLARKSSPLRGEAIQALTLRNHRTTAEVLLGVYGELDYTQRQNAISVLVTRRNFANELLAAIEEGTVDRRDVSAFALQQLGAFDDPAIKKRVAALWAHDSGQLEKSARISRFQQQMTTEFLQQGDAAAGRVLFENTCAKCHSLYGEGGKIGPDLTGSGRQKVDYLLSNLIDPSTVIDPAYRLTIVFTADGRVLSGFMMQQSDHFIRLQTQDGPVRLSMQEIDELQTSATSMMPEGMLQNYSDEQVRDLLLYLTSAEQVPLPLSVSGE